MNTSLTISLDTRRAKKDGSFPLMMRLTHHRLVTSIPTGFSLKEKDWNEKDRKVKSSYGGVSSVTRLNNMLQKMKADAMDIIIKLHEAGELDKLSLVDIRNRIDRKSDSPSFFAFAADVIVDLRKANRIGTADAYDDAITALKAFGKGKDLSFNEVTYALLVKFETQHISKGQSYNGLGAYMRGIRAIYNRAIKAGLIDKTAYPFESYKIKKVPTRKRALDWENLEKIIKKNIAAGQPYFHARNYFLASYMMYGMNFTDMAYLRKVNIIDGRIQYRRSKTSKLFDIKISPQLDSILSYYIAKNPDSEYVFPILKGRTAEEQHKHIEDARGNNNKSLKKLAKHCGIEVDLTTYVSRHSFATQAMLHNVPLNAISTMLGHTSLSTTEIYLKSLPTNILDDYNSKILPQDTTAQS